MKKSERYFDKVMTMFITEYLDMICDRDGQVLPFHECEPYLQDFCGDVGVSFLELREWLIDRGWIEEVPE